LAILVAIFFIKGKDSFDDISGTAWKVALAVLLLFAAATALFGGYRALRAAYGTPRDEFLGEVPKPFQRLRPTTPRNTDEYDTVSAWHHAFTRQAVNDLRLAKAATIASLLAVTAAAAITWFAPGPSSHTLASVTYKKKGKMAPSICGEIVGSPAGTLDVKSSNGVQNDLHLSDVLSIEIVKTCP